MNILKRWIWQTIYIENQKLYLGVKNKELLSQVFLR